ncbi:MAG: thioesterase family protein [Balneolaceae bacterium]|nr:thioesterase family protein [Balneolaceae bacterium]
MFKPTYDPERFPNWCTIEIRYRDLDTLNHVNNAIFSTYFEEARIKFIRQLPAFSSQLKEGFSFVLARVQIDFVKPVEYPETLLVGTGVKELGNTSITCFQAIYRESDHELAAVMEASGVWFDLEKGRPARLPEIPDASPYILDDSLFSSNNH